MKIEIKVPQLPESVSEATLIQWRKKVGEAVVRDENLIDLETDKVVLELPAPQSGVIAQIVVDNGATVHAGETIAFLETTVEAQGESPSSKAAADEKPAPAVPNTPDPTLNAPVALPAARKLMEEHSIDAAQVHATGRGGRITKGDVLEALEKPPVPSVAHSDQSVAPSPSPADRVEQRVPMSRLRLRVAERLLKSQQECAMLTTFNEVNMKPIMDLRAAYRDKFEKANGIRLGFMGFFIKAAVYALKKYPIVNASIDGNDVVYHGYFDIGIAVGSARGLVVPILRDADQLSFADTERAIADFGARAQAGKLTIEELSGGTFTISNGGVFGSLMSTPIINPPQSAILGIHATKERPVVENGQIVIRPMNYLALSYDHRLIDGREAVLALVAMKEALEDPVRILLDV